MPIRVPSADTATLTRIAASQKTHQAPCALIWGHSKTHIFAIQLCVEHQCGDKLGFAFLLSSSLAAGPRVSERTFQSPVGIIMYLPLAAGPRVSEQMFWSNDGDNDVPTF